MRQDHQRVRVRSARTSSAVTRRSTDAASSSSTVDRSRRWEEKEDEGPGEEHVWMTSPTQPAAADDFDDFEDGQAEDEFGELDDASVEGERPPSADHGVVHVSEGGSWTTSDPVGVSVSSLHQASGPNGHRLTVTEHEDDPVNPSRVHFLARPLTLPS